MKPAIAILAVFAAGFALPWLGARTMRRAWFRGGAPSVSGHRGAGFALLILRKAGVRDVGIAEGGRLFNERFDAAAGDIVLSAKVYDGRHISALAWAALQAGRVLRHKEHSKPLARLACWQRVLRVCVNILPAVALFMVFHPASWRGIPLLGLFCLLLAAAQVLTFPAVREAGSRARKVVLEHRLLPPGEMKAFEAALKGASERHLAAPFLDCFWLRWLM